MQENTELGNYTEQELVQGIIKRDADAFNHLHDYYSGALLKHISYTIKEKGTAADILQNVFIKIYARISSYDASKGRLFTWMLTIARNETCDVFRQKGYKIVAKTLEWESLPGIGLVNPYLKIDAADLRKTILTLTPDLRNLIELSFFYGYTHQEIAELLSMPLGTVKTKIRKAYGQLRELVSN